MRSEKTLYSYSRAQAIEEGVLVDLSQTDSIRQHWKYPFACTSVMWAIIEEALQSPAKMFSASATTSPPSLSSPSKLAAPRGVFRDSILASATALVVAHNHPSGDPAPSAADVQMTRVLREAAKVIDIELMDHGIVGDAKADPTVSVTIHSGRQVSCDAFLPHHPRYRAGGSCVDYDPFRPTVLPQGPTAPGVTSGRYFFGPSERHRPRRRDEKPRLRHPETSADFLEVIVTLIVA